MGTFVNLGIESLGKRFDEIDLILNEASKNFEKNDSLYKAFCRSAQVLLSAHFEGYLKELIRNSLEDINQYSSFKNSNKELKKKLCEYYILAGGEKGKGAYNLKVQEMIELFDNLDTKFKKEYFFGSDNNNPKASILERIAEQFGVKNFFSSLAKTNLSLVFSNTHPENIQLCNEFKEYLFKHTEIYPYTITLDFLEIDDEKADVDLWKDFLSGMLKRRHDIAHGTETDNAVGHKTIQSDRIKVEILIYAFTSYICLKCNPVKP